MLVISDLSDYRILQYTHLNQTTHMTPAANDQQWSTAVT